MRNKALENAPFVKIIKTADVGAYQFSPTDFTGLPFGSKFKITVLRGSYSLAPDAQGRQHLVDALSIAGGLYVYTEPK